MIPALGKHNQTKQSPNTEKGAHDKHWEHNPIVCISGRLFRHIKEILSHIGIKNLFCDIFLAKQLIQGLDRIFPYVVINRYRYTPEFHRFRHTGIVAEHIIKKRLIFLRQIPFSLNDHKISAFGKCHIIFISALKILSKFIGNADHTYRFPRILQRISLIRVKFLGLALAFSFFHLGVNKIECCHSQEQKSQNHPYHTGNDSCNRPLFDLFIIYRPQQVVFLVHTHHPSIVLHNRKHPGSLSYVLC